MKTIHTLMASSQGKTFSSEADMTAYLDAERIDDPTLRIAFKHAMFAASDLATDAAVTIGSLASDTAVYRPQVAPLGREVGTLLRKAGLSIDRQYSQQEVTEAMAQAQLDVLDKMSVRAELLDRGLIKAGGAITPTPRPGTRDLSAASTPPKRTILRDPKTGTPTTLRGYSW
jgi:hypothetical protein